MAVTILFVAFFALLLLGVPVAFALIDVLAARRCCTSGCRAVVVVLQTAAGRQLDLADRDPAVRLRRRADDARRHLRPADRLRRGAGRHGCAAASRQVNVLVLAVLRRRVGLGHRRRLGDRRHDDPADGQVAVIDRDFAVNVSISAALVALLVPPSHNLILFSASAGGSISIADLFAAGILPALLLTAAVMVTVAHHRRPARLRGRGLSRASARCWCGWSRRCPGLLLVGADLLRHPRRHLHRHRERGDRGRATRLLVTGIVYRRLDWAVFMRSGDRRGAHDRTDPVRDRRGRVVRLAAGLPAGAGRGRRDAAPRSTDEQGRRSCCC